MGFTTPVNRPCIGAQGPVAELQQGGFTGATGTQQNHALVGTKRDVDRLEPLPKGDLLQLQLQLSRQRIFPSWRPTVSIIT